MADEKLTQKQVAQKRIRDNEAEKQRSIDAAKAANKAKMAADKARGEEENRLAKSLRPLSSLQPEVFPRLTERLTLPLGTMIKAAAAAVGHKKQRFVWVCVSKGTARDILQRGYGLGLQLGLAITPHDRDNTLVFSGGSTIEFTWPDKALPEPRPADVVVDESAPVAESAPGPTP